MEDNDDSNVEDLHNNHAYENLAGTNRKLVRGNDSRYMTLCELETS